MSNCLPCDEFKCAKDVPWCIDQLFLGVPPAYTGDEYTIVIKYNLGGDEVYITQPVDDIYSSQLVLDLTNLKSQLNPHNSSFKLWVTQRGDINNPVFMTKDGVNYERVQFDIIDVDTNLTSFDLEIVPCGS